ncbi:serine hydrolase [Pseudomarimonas arenosa]|uniref:Serine hydrolase n=1 Tax=Pseudomarimonas arenosa TaxID=2774145 RepID=A0AAW3ZM74_9GAMM|nr:serine hydrolase [Pseudomarimonas arenosa]MBD8525772.1 serine hydrolase [Pseudomarimonas arenosa]
MRSIASLALWLCLSGLAAADVTAPAAPAALADTAHWQALMSQTRKRFQVPGIAMAIVHDGKVVFAGGSGLRELGTTDAVDAHTQFAIASLTKAFTATALSILADEGKLDLDDRVIDHLPEFAMADPFVSREMRLRDLLVHRSGLALGAGDLLFWPASSLSTTEIVQRLRQVPLSTSFRADYAYDNVLYAVATLVIERVAGLSFFDFLQQRIFDPAGLRETRVNADALQPGDSNIAVGHAKFDLSELRTVPPMTWSNNPGAGGLYSSVHDLARWMQIQLDGGLLGSDAEGKERRLLSAERHAATWQLITPIPIRPARIEALAPATPQFLGYGLGWVISEFRGHRVISHTGGWPGMVSKIALVPSRKLGVVVLSNAETGAAFNTLVNSVLDAGLGIPSHDWLAAYGSSVDRSQEEHNEDWRQHESKRERRSRPSLPLAGYAGRYQDPWYGEVTLSLQGSSLRIAFQHTPQLVGRLDHWQHDSFVVRWDDRSLNADAFASFALGPDGDIRQLSLEAISPLTDFSFDFHHLDLRPIQAPVPSRK